MEITEMTIKVVWHKPSENDLPTETNEYYTVDNYGKHRIMTYHAEGGWGGMNWEGDLGSNSMKSNEEIAKWTELLCVG